MKDKTIPYVALEDFPLEPNHSEEFSSGNGFISRSTPLEIQEIVDKEAPLSPQSVVFGEDNHIEERTR